MKTWIGKTIGTYFNALSVVAPAYAARKGFEFFCYPRREKLLPHHFRFFQSGKTIEFPLGDEIIRAYQWGHGPIKVLFLHGWQSHSFRWKKYIEAYPAEQYTLYSIDAPGHGLSTGNFLTVPYYSEAVVAFLERIGKIDHVVSHSIGSFTAAYTFYHRRDLSPARLVLLAPPGAVNEFFEFYKNVLGLTDNTSKHIEQHFKKVIGNPPAYYAVHRFTSAFSFPGLIIHDREDPDTHFSNAEKIHTSWSNSKLLLTQGFGHNLKSDDVLREVMEFTGVQKKL